MRVSFLTDSVKLLGAVVLGAVALLVGAFSLAIWFDVITSLVSRGHMIGGKANIYVFLFPALAWLLAKWAREAWRSWKGDREKARVG